jgi:hypothetical protein
VVEKKSPLLENRGLDGYRKELTSFERIPARVYGRLSQFSFDAQQLVVLGNPI